MTSHLHTIVNAQKHGKAAGITSICSANPFVLRAALENARNNNRFVCIESTGRQVNQDGGYTGMTPDRFAENVRQLCHKVKLEEKKILIGGDHLGPGAWCFENSDTAMAKAGELVRQCVFAGYRKLHLDPTMPCKDDILNKRPGLSMKTIADRTACLCKTAETAAAEYSGGKSPLTYVVGAEVPAPGGVLNSTYEIRISSANDVEQTIQCTGRITTPAMMNT